MKTEEVVPALFWLLAIMAVLGYGGLFLGARRPAAVRVRGLAIAGAVVLALRALLIATRTPVQTVADVVLTSVALVATCVAALGRRVWLVRAPHSDLREKLITAACGLRLTCSEQEGGKFLLTSSSESHVLRLCTLAPALQVMWMPVVSPRSKLSLLERWLARQYSGPLPRLRIILKRSNNHGNRPR